VFFLLLLLNTAAAARIGNGCCGALRDLRLRVRPEIRGALGAVGAGGSAVKRALQALLDGVTFGALVQNRFTRRPATSPWRR